MKLARISALGAALFLTCLTFGQNITGLGINPTPVRPGTNSVGQVTVASPAPPSGWVIGLESNSPAAVVPNFVEVQTNSLTGTFPVTGVNSGYTRLTATISAYTNIFERTAKVTILPANYSEFVDQTVPTTMTIGQSYSVTLRFRNPAGRTWDAAHFYKLHSWNGIDNMRWGTKRMRLMNAPVAPGQIGVFSGTVIAPSTPGVYGFQWRCLQDDIFDSFGPASPNVFIGVNAGTDGAQFLGQSNVPTSVVAGQTFTPSISFKNSGTSTWSSATGYVLKSRNPYNNTYWGTNTVQLPNTIPPQGTVTFSPTLTAPATPGTYSFAWFMMHNSGFGEMPPIVNISVTPPDNASFVSQTGPNTVSPGQQFNVGLTFKNTGITTWTSAEGYYAISQNPTLNTTWTTNRVNIPVGANVAPGTNILMTAHLTAPATPGTYAMQWRMSRSDVGFGQASQVVNVQVVAPDPLNAEFVSQTTPITAVAGQHYIALVTFKNNGAQSWPLNSAIGIYPQPDTKWALNYLSTGSVITVGNSRTYTLDLVAPYSPGNHALQFRMRNLDTNAWFGQSSTTVTVSVSPSQYAQSPWPGGRGGRDRQTGRGFGAAGTGVLVWTFNGPDYFQTTPAIGADGTVYIGCKTGDFYALNGATGAVKWSKLFAASINASPILGADGTVYVFVNNGNVTALDGATGTQKWVYPVSDFANWFQGHACLGSNGTLYFTSGTGHVYAVNASNGTLKWQSLSLSSIQTGIAIGQDGTLYLAGMGSPSNGLFALDATTGTLLWNVHLPPAVLPGGTYPGFSGTPAIGYDGTIYLSGQGGSMYAVSPSTRSIKWQYLIGAQTAAAATVGANSTVYIGSQNGKLHAFDGATGAIKWTFTTGGNISSSPVISGDGTVFVLSSDGKLYALEPATGAVKFSFAHGDSISLSSPAIGADGTIYFGTASKRVWAVK